LKLFILFPSSRPVCLAASRAEFQQSDQIFLFFLRIFSPCTRLAIRRSVHDFRIDQDKQTMKTVLKDIKTGLLFRHMDEWTSDIQEAAGFRDTPSALKFCQRNNLTGVAIVHAYRNGNAPRVVGFYRRNSKSSAPLGQEALQ
jgi:hypothetical protein